MRSIVHALRLFFLFLARHRSVAEVRLDDINVESVLAFLDDLESARKNTASTRNCRLAAVRGFVEHLLRHDVSRAAQYQRVLAVRAKKTRSRAIEYLEPEHVRSILAQPDRRTAAGARDYALLIFLYNTGARVSEALAVTPTDLHLAAPRHVRLRGKGDKERICPLWPETATALTSTLAAATTSSRSDTIFRSARGTALTRDGAAYILGKYAALAAREIPLLKRRRVTPHVLRLSCAVALLQAGVDVTVIRDYLGHASIATTSRYISTNVDVKRDVLDAFWRRAGLVKGPQRRWRPTPHLLAFLSSL